MAKLYSASPVRSNLRPLAVTGLAAPFEFVWLLALIADLEVLADDYGMKDRGIKPKAMQSRKQRLMITR